MKLFIPEGHTHVLGRSREKAAELLRAAKVAGLEGQVATTTDGYIVPDAVVEQVEFDAKSDADAQADVDAQAQADADAEAAKQAAADADKATADLFDPSAHNVDEVKAYLETADEAERARVLAAEETGKKRVSLLDNTEGAK